MQQKRYWLRGGIILFLLYVLTSLILIPFGVEGHECYWFCLYYWSLPSFLPVIIFSLIIKIVTGHEWDSFQLLGGYGVFVEASIVYFVLGAILGWLYGKIRNRKKVVNML